jgi:hypothetical protein
MKTKLTKTQVKTLKQGLHGGFLPLLASLAPALLGAIAPKALDAVGTFGGHVVWHRHGNRHDPQR